MDISAERLATLTQAYEISERLHVIRERISAAAERAGRNAGAVTLVAVTKKHPVTAIKAALEVGLTEIGENYVQEAREKRHALAEAELRWHLLGHLQTNKVQIAVETFDLIQSVDSVRLARLLSKHAQAIGKTQDILLQVHLGDEATKFGLLPEAVSEGAHEILLMPGLSLCGLMGIAPQGEEPRSYFRLLRQISEGLPTPAQSVLSMGMTGDFESAVEEGATMVRIGTALFGQRNA